MRRYLVVANQTLGGERLMEEIRGRLAAGPASFRVLVPDLPYREFPLVADGEGMVVVDQGAEDRWQQRANLAAESRLQQLVAQIKAEGGEARGERSASDPLQAIESVLGQGEQFDEIIISTLPSAVSRWLRMDLPHRVERKFKIAVTTVTAKG